MIYSNIKGSNGDAFSKMKSTDNKSLDKQKLNLSLSRILQLDERDYGVKLLSFKGKKLSIDDIPTKGKNKVKINDFYA